MLKSNLFFILMIVYLISTASALSNVDIVIKFNDINPGVRYIILKNNIEEFQIEFDQHEEYRKFYIDSSGFIKLQKEFLVKEFLEGDSIMDAFYCDSRFNRFTRFKINVNKDTNFINIQ